MGVAAWVALMISMKCHTIVIDVRERQETLAYTVCIRLDALEEKAKKQKDAKRPFRTKKRSG